MTTELVPTDYNSLLALAEQIARSPLMPQAYRGKPADAAIAMLYGAECGLPPMTSLQRINVVNGKPGLDSQGMVALIRSRGHHITGTMTNEVAEVLGKRADNGDEMAVTFTIDDAKRAGLVAVGNPYGKYPSDMLWSKAVSRIGRRLFADVLMGFSYTDDEVESFDRGSGKQTENGQPEVDTGSLPALEPADTSPAPDVIETTAAPTLRPPPTVVPAIVADESTGEVLDSLRAAAEADEQLPKVSELDEKKQVLNDIVRSTQPMGEQAKLKAHLLGRYGASANITDPAIMQECIDIAIGWPQTDPRGAPAVQPQEIPF